MIRWKLGALNSDERDALEFCYDEKGREVHRGIWCESNCELKEGLLPDSKSYNTR